MVLWINESSTIGIIMSYAVTNITGSLVLALLMILIAIIVITFMFKVPLEFGALLIMPLTLGLMAYDSQFVPFGGVVLFIIVIYLVKAWLFR